MCRLAFFPKGTDVTRPRVATLLADLEDMQGGDGAGIATWDKEGHPQVIKGVKVKGMTLGRILRKKGNDNGWLFHARAASIGPKVDQLNQPFSTGDFLFVHNGHWNDWRILHFALMVNKGVTPNEHMNDSRVLSQLVQIAGLDALSWMSSGVYIGWKKGSEWPYAYVQQGQFAYSSLPEDEGGGFVYASAFPDTWPMNAYEFADNSCIELRAEGPKVRYGEAPKKAILWSRSYSASRGAGFRGRVC